MIWESLEPLATDSYTRAMVPRVTLMTHGPVGDSLLPSTTTIAQPMWHHEAVLLYLLALPHWRHSNATGVNGHQWHWNSMITEFKVQQGENMHTQHAGELALSTNGVSENSYTGTGSKTKFHESMTEKSNCFLSYFNPEELLSL